MEAVVGVRGETALAVLVLIFFSFVAGLVARTNAGRRIMRWSENSLLGGLPQYQLVKSMAEGLAHVESAESVNPALVSIEGGWQIGYLLEPLENGWVTVFLPQAPTPMSGNVMYLPADRVHDGPGHGDRETHWRRLRQSSARHRPHASRRRIGLSALGSGWLMRLMRRLAMAMKIMASETLRRRS
jgi:hypothetical protein